ncbi:MAG: NAD(P)/FAD-dependent oxidoreductase [Actinobacteria bacterium]|nr:NAD(P)/FAD-dependent oxidoreductase [Actinomycetota bacterium]
MAEGNGLLIVGGGLASARAIKAYREAGGEGTVRLISADSFVPYHRPPLSKRYLRGEAEVADTLVEPEAFYAEHGVEVELEAVVATLDLERRRVLLEGGGEREFDRLLIASGATPRRLDVPGIDLEGVHTLRTLDSSTAIRDAARGARHAVVVGAGFIGMEVAASLKQLGLEVTLVHRGKGLFELLRARQLMQFLADLYAREGVELVLGDEVQSFGGRTALDSIETSRGRVIQAELAVVGIGVAPATGWLEDTGLQLDDGVVVNERFETGVENVWAVGDVARFYDPIFAKHRRIEHWSNANYAGAEVGKLIAGGEGGFDTVSAFFSEVFGLTLRVFGDVEDVDDIVFRGTLEEGKAIGFYVRDGRLAAALVVGQDDETEDRLKELIRAGARVADPARLADEDAPLDEVLET